MILVDTSGFFALVDRDDVHHTPVCSALEAAVRGGETLLTHNYIVVECLALMQRRLGMEPTRAFLRDLEKVVLEWVDRDLHDVAMERFRAAGRKLSLVDCVSLELARRRSIGNYIGFDPDFDRAGLRRYGPGGRDGS